MNDASPPNITSSPPGHNRRAEEPRLPTRDELRDAETFHQGRRIKADLLTLDLGQGPMIVKDFARKPWWVRLIGRAQIRRESAAYVHLGAMDGIPHWIGRVDGHALAMERIDGACQLGYAPLASGRGAECFRRLRVVVDRMHAAGLVHLDIRAKDNVLLREDGEIVIVDLASAVWMRPGGLMHRLFFRSLSIPDRSALLKWKRLLDAGPYTAEELAFLRRHHRLRVLWPFDPKRSKRGTESS